MWVGIGHHWQGDTEGPILDTIEAKAGAGFLTANDLWIFDIEEWILNES